MHEIKMPDRHLYCSLLGFNRQPKLLTDIYGLPSSSSS